MAVNDDKILVEIAAYRDPQLLYTVCSAIVQADNPERVYFAICLQSDNLEQLATLKKLKNCRIKYMKEADARGSCYARYLCQQMIEDEKYIFQIDSHMRFVRHWDTKMIQMLHATKDKKASISFYPPACTKEMMKLPLDDKEFDKPGTGGQMYTYGFNDGDSHFIGNNCISQSYDKKLILRRNPFISAGNFFSYADIHREVIHDPNMYFYGDELPMALRYFTHGWNNYGSNISYVYHEYNRENRKWPQRPPKYDSEDARFNELLNLDHKNVDMGQFGLGKERTIKDFEEFVGLDFSKRKVYMSAELGIFDDPSLKKQLSFIKDKKYKNEQYINKPEKITVIVIDPDGEYDRCIKSCIDTATYKENIQFYIATTKKEELTEEELKEKQIKKIINYKKSFSYCVALAKLVNSLDDCYTVIVDSSVLFIGGWDKYNLREIKKYGENGIITDWVWYNPEPKYNNNLQPYYNSVKVFDRFEYYMPVLKFNSDIKISERITPYKTQFISDGFMFCHSKVFKKVRIDPKLRYDEHQYIYSVRLWTNGFDIYYPITTFFYRTKDQSYLNSGDYHYGIINAIVGYSNEDSKKIKPGYKYQLGEERPLWTWYDAIGFDFTKDRSYNVYEQ